MMTLIEIAQIVADLDTESNRESRGELRIETVMLAPDMRIALMVRGRGGATARVDGAVDATIDELRALVAMARHTLAIQSDARRLA